MADKTLWGIHMDPSVGSTPTEKGFVAIGWSELGDLSKVGNTRDAIKKVVKEKVVGAKPGSIPVQAGVIYRFLYEVKEGDVVVYPSKIDRMVNLGLVAGPYSRRKAANEDDRMRYRTFRPRQLKVTVILQVTAASLL